MASVQALGAPALYTICDPGQFTFETTAELADIDVAVGQARAMGAIRFGIGIKGHGYNIFALGPSGLGRFTAVQEMLVGEANKRPAPPDWCYVNNFHYPQRPNALRLPAGKGERLQGDMDKLVDDLSAAIPAAFEGEDYRRRIEEFEQEIKERQAKALEALKEEAEAQHIAFLHTPAGFAFAPMNGRREVLTPEQFAQLPKEEQRRMESVVGGFQESLQRILRQFPVWAKEAREKVKVLNREIALYAVSHLIDSLKSEYLDLEDVPTYLDEVQEDIIANVAAFLPPADGVAATTPQAAAREAVFERYTVNLLVNNSGQTSAPVVYEDLPSHINLLGCAEYQAQMGALVTDFTLIKAGALHLANGGYLILDAHQVLIHPFAWDGLKRALQAGEIRIEPPERQLGLISTVSLEPQPIPLDVKVVLVGERPLYYLLDEYDSDFRDLFKVAADFEDRMDRNGESALLYARLFATLARQNHLKPLDRGGVARLIEHSARLTEDAEKLSTHLRSLTDLLREADFWAAEADRAVIGLADVQRAIDAQIHRLDRVRGLTLEEIRRGTLMIATSGAVIGQINGLAVLQLGDFAFGKPTRITATVRLGEGEVIDIERETKLGGAIHSKGVLILASFLVARYVPDRPLALAASLVFEQSYGMVEGDSASLAELCALLSALAELPIQQGLAVTGSVDQLGRVQPIGGVNEKIEGFFDVCQGAGPNDAQGVLIPATNVKHLMLRQEVVEAARDGRFRVFPITTVDEAIELLTGVSAGARNGAGQFPVDSVNGRAEAKLAAFAAARQRFGKSSNEDVRNGG